ncbi:MAG: hypothetical protein WAT29_02175 [Thiolinea sp.]
MINANAYRLGQLITLQQSHINEAKQGIAYIKLTLSFAFVTTWILYFIFAFAFYVADLWGISTWLTQNTSELAAFALFLLMALLMAQSLSMIKHAFYHHKAAFQYGIAALLVICSLGVFMELFNSSSQQQTIAHHTAEQSKSFAAVNNSVVNLPTSTNASRIASLSGELATAQSYLEGCKKTCNHYRAKVANLEQQIESLKASDAASLEASKSIGDQTLKTKAELSEKLKEEAHKPVFKFIRDVLGVTISTAVVIISCIVAAGFEFSHALLSRMLGEKLAHLAALQDQLIKLRTDYLTETGSEYGSAPLPSSEPENLVPSQFKYQQAAPFVSGFSSFKQPTLKPCIDTSTPIQAIANKTERVKQEEQLPLPEFGRFKARGGGWASPALSDADTAPMDIAANVRVHAEPTHITKDVRVHTPLDVRAHSTKDADQALLEALKDAQGKMDADTLKEAFGAYDLWKAALLNQEPVLSARGGRDFINRQLCQARKKTITPAGMDALLVVWRKRAAREGLLTPNPRYTGKPPHPEYLLAARN